MKRAWPWLVGLLMVGGGVWVWTQWAANPERQIRKRLAELEELVSFSESDGLVSAALSWNQLGSFFTRDAVVRVGVEGDRTVSLSGRAEILEYAKAARGLADGLTVDFLDVVVTLAPDGDSADVAATGSARQAGSNERWIQELRFKFVRTDEGWLISRVETVRMLSGVCRTDLAGVGLGAAL